jgi:phytoene dehydrogenase-like protein
MTMTESTYDAAVVGGGLGGLVAATLIGQAGLSAVVLERARELGGRAATHRNDGFFFNLGAHALYLGGAAARVLAQLGVRWTGRQPPASGVAECGGRTHALPTNLGALLATGLLGMSGKVQGARLFARLRSIDPAGLTGVPLGGWLEHAAPNATLRASIEAFARVSTYANAPALVDAGATIAQIQLSRRRGVAYVDGGWQTLVDGAAQAARAVGVRIRTSAPVVTAAPRGGGWEVSVDGAPGVRCRSLVLAAGPTTARSIVASEALAAWARRAVPARAACLDVALARLPDPVTTFALGVDRPLYFSVHSRTARLAPEGAALVHTMKYLSPAEQPDPARDEVELEGWLDRLQPGWRDVVTERRWLPAMVASNALVTADGGGLAGRPGPSVPDAPGVFVVGDWVGGEGMLLDASLASAERAAGEATRWLSLSRLTQRSGVSRASLGSSRGHPPRGTRVA